MPEKNVTPSRLQQLKSRLSPRWQLTLFGRSLLLFVAELLVNAIIWAVALALFAPHQRTRSALSLCVIAWTLGLRHGLDMDHLVAIDNVTRNLVFMGRLPVTVGLWFSLGHSSIVVGATIAIVISVSAIDKIPDVSAIGGVIGVSVSASFLFLLAVINSVILWQTIRQQRRRRLMAETSTERQVPVCDEDTKAIEGDIEQADLKSPDKEQQQQDQIAGLHPTTCLARIGRPIFKVIDAPWKMYPVGVLFGFGFDTASEISLLGVSALAAGDKYGRLPHSQILVLPLLFTAGMTFVDSCDSIFMLHAYAVPGRAVDDTDMRPWYRKLQILERRTELETPEALAQQDGNERRADLLPAPDQDRMLRVSVVLTVISIAIALLISITQFMGLALEKCSSCAEAAESDPGLSGQWWRFWQHVNDQSYYIGAGVIGLFVVVFGGWGIGHWWQRRKARKAAASQPIESSRVQEDTDVKDLEVQ